MEGLVSQERCLRSRRVNAFQSFTLWLRHSSQCRYLLGGRRWTGPVIHRGGPGSSVYRTDNQVDGFEPRTSSQDVESESVHWAHSTARRGPFPGCWPAHDGNQPAR